MQKVVVFSVSTNSPCAEKREIFYSKYLPTCLLILPHQTTSFLESQQAGSTEVDALVLNSTYRHTGPRGKQCTWSAPVKYFSSTALCWCCSLPWVLSPTDLKRKKIYKMMCTDVWYRYTSDIVSGVVSLTFVIAVSSSMDFKFKKDKLYLQTEWGLRQYQLSVRYHNNLRTVQQNSNRICGRFTEILLLRTTWYKNRYKHTETCTDSHPSRNGNAVLWYVIFWTCKSLFNEWKCTFIIEPLEAVLIFYMKGGYLSQIYFENTIW